MKMSLPKNSESPAPSQADIEKFKILSERLGLTAIREDVDQLKTHLNNMITELGNTNATLTQVVNLLNQSQQPTQPSPTSAAPTQPVMNFKSLDPVSQSQVVQNLFTGLSSVVTAWKGGTPQTDPMGDLGKQMLTDLVRATVDDIQQRVYGIRKLPPPGIRQDIAQVHKLE